MVLNKNKGQKMKKLLIIILSATVMQVSAGTKDSGGDPYAQNFIERAKKISLYLMENPKNSRFSFDVKAFDVKVREYSKSIEDESVKDLVEFVKDKPQDRFGVEKPAVFNSETGLIKVHIGSWDEYKNDDDRFILTMMEFLGLIEAENRYKVAESVIEEASLYLEKVSIDVYNNPQFKGAVITRSLYKDVTENDLLIYVGTFGTGSQKNIDAVEFLKNPDSNPKLLEQIYDGLLSQKRVYLVFGGVLASGALKIGFDLHLKNGDLALNEMSMVYHVPVSEYASLDKFADYKSCKIGESPDNTKVIEFLNRCLDSHEKKSPAYSGDHVFSANKNAGLSHISKYISELYAPTIRDFALSSFQISYKNMSVEIPTTPFAEKVQSEEFNEIMVNALYAFGLRPSLSQPTEVKEDGSIDDHLLYWSTNSEGDKKSRRAMRLTSLAIAAAKSNLVYIDGQTTCDIAVGEESKEVAGPNLIKRSSINSCSSYRMYFRPHFSLTVPGFAYKQGLVMDLDGKWLEHIITPSDEADESFEVKKLEIDSILLYSDSSIGEQIGGGFTVPERGEAEAYAHEVYSEITTRKLSSKQRLDFILKQVEGESDNYTAYYIKEIFESFGSMDSIKKVMKDDDVKKLVDESISLIRDAKIDGYHIMRFYQIIYEVKDRN